MEFRHDAYNPINILFFILVIQSEESEVQTETKPDEDNPGVGFNWSKL